MDSTGRAWLRAVEVVPGEDGLTRSEVSSELVFDPSGHVRLPIDDDEIIDRALAIEPLADGKVTLLTYDTGQFTREVVMEPGHAHWLPAQTHAGQNIGTTPTHGLFMELKETRTAAPAQHSRASRASAVTPPPTIGPA